MLVVVCGQAICDYTRVRGQIESIIVVVCGQAICDYTWQELMTILNTVVVCGQAICDYTGTTYSPPFVVLWFAVRLYAITLLGCLTRHE